jgi:Na+-translocating ferredoxin:NAD+ oxidoreductase RNF subunit RnfB
MVRILLRLSEDLVSEPVVSQVILENKVQFAILSAHINSKGGEIVLEVPDEATEKVVQAFREKGASVSVPKLIEVDDKKCFSCGSCVALCPVEAISVGSDSTINFDKEKCVGSTCSICVDACPARAIKSIRYTNSNNHLNNQEK